MRPTWIKIVLGLGLWACLGAACRPLSTPILAFQTATALPQPSLAAPATPAVKETPPGPFASATPAPKISPTPRLTSAAPIASPTPTLPAYGRLLARTGKGAPGAASYSRDGKNLAVLSPAGVSIFDAASLKEQRLVAAPGIQDIFYRPDGSLWGISRLENGLQFWRRGEQDWQAVTLIPCGEQCVYQVAPDGARVGTYDIQFDRKISTQAALWQIDSGAQLAASDLLNYDISLAMSQGGARMALMDPNLAVLSVYRLKDGRFESFYTLKVDQLIPDYNRDSYPDYLVLGYDQMRLPLGMSADGKYVAVGGPDYVARVFQPDHPDQPAVALADQAPDPLKRVDGLRFAPGGQALTVTQAGQLYLYRASDWKLIAWQKDGGSPLAFSPDGTQLAAFAGGKIQLSSAQTGVRAGAIQGFAGDVRKPLFVNDGQTLAFLEGSNLNLWDFNDPKKNRVIATGKETVVDLALSADGKRYALALGDQKCGWAAVGELAGTAPAVVLRSPQDCLRVNQVVLAADGKTLAVGEPDFWDIWRETAGTFEFQTRLPVVKAGPAAFSPDGQTLVYLDAAPALISAYAFNGRGGPEQIDVDGSRALRVLDAHSAGWLASLGWVALTVDSSNTVVAGRQGLVERGATLALPRKPAPAEYGFTPDGARVAGIDHGSLLVWDAHSGAFLGGISGQRAARAFSFSPDGQKVVILETGGMLSVWQLN